MLKEIKVMDGYKNIISEIKFYLGNYYFRNKLYKNCISLYEDSLNYLSPSSSNDKIKNLILIKLSESYQEIGDKQKAIDILNKAHTNNSINSNNSNNKINIDNLKKINSLSNNNKNKINEVDEENPENNSIVSSLDEKMKDEYDYENFIQNQINENENNVNENNNNVDEDDEDEGEVENKINIRNEIDDTHNNKKKNYNKEEFKIMSDELNLNKNKILNVNYIFSNEKSEDVFPSKILENFLSKKRRFNSAFLHKYSPTNSVVNYDYSFDNYLHRRMRNLSNNNSINNNSTVNNITLDGLNLNDLKEDYEKLVIEIKKNIDLYLKLQESLLLLNNNEIDKFLEITYEPLKTILTQELQIENYLKDLFRYFLEKSNIKNYFNKKSSIFDKSLFDDNFGNNISNLNISNTTNNNIINLEENENNDNNDVNLLDNDNLFVRKSTSKIFLTKKK